MILGWDIARKKTISKWRPSAILNIRNLVFWSHDLCRNMITLLLTEFRVNRAINRRDIAKNDFQYDTRPPYWIHCDVIILHPGTLCYAPNIVLNFHLDWFSTFWYTWSFMFHHFGWKLPIQGQIFRVLGVNRGQISIFHFITRKRHILARFRVFWAIARQNPSRGLFSTLVREKIIK